jgi:glycosidase
VADSDEKVAEYTGRFASDPDDLVGVDAALDFPLFYRLPGVLKGFKDNSPLAIANLFEERKALHRGRAGREPKVLISSHGEASRYFVTFLDNHDQHARFHYAEPADPQMYDAQLSLGVGCLIGLQGIPCLYYGTEQGLCGRGNSDQDVREALWGKSNAFDEAHPFYRFIQALTALRREHPALRYGRQYFREISGDGTNFGISPYGPGVLAFARILNDTEILVVANTQTESSFDGLIVVDFALNPLGTSWEILLSNHGTAGPNQVIEKTAGMVIVHRLDGVPSHGPLRVIPARLEPMEIQFLGRREV